MKGIFFGDARQIRAVYSGEQRGILQKLYGCGKIYTQGGLGSLPAADILFSTWGMPALTEREIRQYFPSLRAVFYAAGSVQAFARSFLECGVHVYSAWQANAVPVTETAVAQILLANKGFFYLSRLCKNDYAAARRETARFMGNFGAKVGILGSGAIGMRVIGELRRHDLDVYVCSPEFTEEAAERTGAKRASLTEIFAECGVISNHIADRPETRGMIGRGVLSLLRPYSTFINTGRGAQVDEAALIEVLERDRTVTAVLDVTFPEPPLPESKLFTLENVVLTPHSAGSSGAEVHRMAQYMIEESCRFASGKECLFEVTAQMLQTMA